MDNYSQKIIDSFFQPFYDTRIKTFKNLGPQYNQLFDIQALLFWFSVIDFYGGLYFIGLKNKKKTYRAGTLKLADKETFTEFIKAFFPSPENKLGEFIYAIFRSGIVHQLSPKKGGIIYDPNNQKLLWIKIDSNNPDNTSNKVAYLNISTLETLAFNSYIEFRRKIENDELVQECKNIFNQLLSQPDGLEDGNTINEQYLKLSAIDQNFIIL